MKTYRAEFHIHTVHSSCAEIEMIPPLIIDTAQERGINLIAITDHNATANAQAVITAADGTGVTVLPGMEMQTIEEVHLLCLFDTIDQAYTWQAKVDAALPNIHNRPEYFGDQLVVDANGDFVRREERLLATSAQISLDEAIRNVNALGGLAVPAHVDRRTNGLIAVLGLIPEDAGIEALEISNRLTPSTARNQYPQVTSYPLLSGGDAHTLDAISGRNLFQLEEPTISEIRRAIHAEAGRSLAYYIMDNLPQYG